MLDPERGPVTWYSRSGLATWADRLWNSEGQQLPRVHHATDRFSVRFADFTVLADWVDRFAAIDGVAIVEVRWRLTRRRQDEVAARVRTAAVRAARDKAQAYADSLELGPVRPVSIADSGMLSDNSGRPSDSHERRAIDRCRPPRRRPDRGAGGRADRRRGGCPVQHG